MWPRDERLALEHMLENAERALDDRCIESRKIVEIRERG